MPGFSGIGFGEMLVIGMLILIVFGPRRLPEISRSMGKAIREFKRGMNEIQRELDVAERESRWGTAGSRAAGAASGSAVSGPATSSAGAPSSESAPGPEPVIAPPAPGGGAPTGTPDPTAAVTESAGPAARERRSVEETRANGGAEGRSGREGAAELVETPATEGDLETPATGADAETAPDEDASAEDVPAAGAERPRYR